MIRLPPATARIPSRGLQLQVYNNYLTRHFPSIQMQSLFTIFRFEKRRMLSKELSKPQDRSRAVMEKTIAGIIP